jgi:hypothetical protein
MGYLTSQYWADDSSFLYPNPARGIMIPSSDAPMRLSDRPGTEFMMSVNILDGDDSIDNSSNAAFKFGFLYTDGNFEGAGFMVQSAATTAGGSWNYNLPIYAKANGLVMLNYPSDQYDGYDRTLIGMYGYSDDGISKLQVGGTVRADSFLVTGGASTSFLKANGSLDTTTYYKSGDSPTFATITQTGKTTTYNNIATEGYGIPAIVDNVSLTAQSASINSTNFTNAGTAGDYQLNYYLETTTLLITAGTVMLTVAFTDDAGATTVTSAALPMTALGRTSGILPITLASGSVSYSTTVVGVPGTARYALKMNLMRLK